MKWPTKLVMKWPKTWPGAVAAIAAAVATVAAIYYLLPVIALGAGLWVGAHTRRQSPPAPLPPPVPRELHTVERLVVVVDPTTGKRTEHRLDDVDDLPAATRRAIRATGPAPAAPRWGAGAMSAPTLAELVAAEVAAELERRRRDLALMRRTGWGTWSPLSWSAPTGVSGAVTAAGPGAAAGVSGRLVAVDESGGPKMSRAVAVAIAECGCAAGVPLVPPGR